MAYVLNWNRSSIMFMSYKIQTTIFRDMQFQLLVDNLEGCFLTKIFTRVFINTNLTYFWEVLAQKGSNYCKDFTITFPFLVLYIGLE